MAYHELYMPFLLPHPRHDTATSFKHTSRQPPVNLPYGLEDWHEPVVPSLVAASKWRD